jgi:hypothetical protein
MLRALVPLIAATFMQSSFATEPRLHATLIGSWTVDVSRLPMVPSARPKSVMITFAEVGPERLKTKVEVIDPSGARLEAEGVTPLDGSPTAVKSNFEADVSATLMPRPEVLITQLAKNGKPASSRIYSVNSDGNSMIETVAYFGKDGRPMLRKNYFSRVR